MVMFIYRTSSTTSPPPTIVIAEIEVAKHRRRNRPLQLGFAAEFSRFNNLTPRSAPM